MKLYTIIYTMFFITTISFGQTKLLPPEIEINDTVLNVFITQLKTAVNSKDKDFIISVLSPDILNSFGGNGGIEEFKTYWNWSTDDSPFWSIMKKLIELGGEKYKGDGFYTIPYVFTNWPNDEKYSSYEHAIITGIEIDVHDKPDSKISKVIGQFSYDIVGVDYEKSYPSFDNALWYYTESLDKKIRGYVYKEYVWSPVGYRATFELIDKEWKMTILVTGD